MALGCLPARGLYGVSDPLVFLSKETLAAQAGLSLLTNHVNNVTLLPDKDSDKEITKHD